MREWFRQTRVRLALAYSGIFSIVAIVAAGVLWTAIARLEYSAIDDSLASESRSIQSTLSSGGALPGSSNDHQVAGHADGSVGVAAFLFDSTGALVDRSGSGATGGALVPAALQAATSSSPVLVTETIDDVPQRVRASLVQLKSGDTRVLVVTRSTAEADQLIRTAATVLLLGMAVLMIAATVLGYGLAGTALRPVREIVAAARAFSEYDLHRRISLDLPNDELGELADTFNGMLARLETAFDSLRRFTADAAHELRGPLTLIRTEAEVTLSRTRSVEEYQASLATVLAEAERLGRMADQLLMLARAEAGALVTRMSAVDLASLAADTVRLWQPLAIERGVTLSCATAGGTVRGDRDLLRRLLDNLIDNALRHSPAASEVVVSTRPLGRGWELAVADSGPGVPEAARGSIFERFSRGDPSRGRDTGGAGLGLALCAVIARLHNGSIELDEEPVPGARFVVRLPAIPAADLRGSAANTADLRSSTS